MQGARPGSVDSGSRTGYNQVHEKRDEVGLSAPMARDKWSLAALLVKHLEETKQPETFDEEVVLLTLLLIEFQIPPSPSPLNATISIML